MPADWIVNIFDTTLMAPRVLAVLFAGVAEPARIARKIARRCSGSIDETPQSHGRPDTTIKV